MAIYGFTGSRKGCTGKQYRTLRRKMALLPPGTEFHHGDAIGADDMAHTLATLGRFNIHLHPCDIDDQRAFNMGAFVTRYDPKPPLDRNADIAEACDTLIAVVSGKEYPSSGTWATIRRARKLGKRIVLVHPDGSVTLDTP